MRKKLIATLVAGAVMSTGLIGLTACGGGHDINKGEEVSKEDWAKAITATVEAKNYTVDAYQEMETKMTGSIEVLGITNLNISAKTTGEAKNYYDLANGSFYVNSSVKATVSGVPDELKDEDEFQARDYVMEQYGVKDGEKYFMAYYDGTAQTPEWSVREMPSIYNNGMAFLFEGDYATEKDGTVATLSELYDAFTYSGGVYSATLWEDGDEETKISLSIKGGYVVGYSVEATHEEGDGNSSMTSSGKYVYNFSNYGGTTVSASDAAKKAVEDYKASNN
ncbi:MAG: hypothetical protein K2I30_02210 [Clostridia bacterium]|nr:hypothetical protein [Clostridia bacterium]